MADLSVCPSCASNLVQPLRWCELDDGTLELELRCPECFAWMRGAYSIDEVRALDRDLRAAREILNATYEHWLRESMEAMADCFAQALALDLVTAEDFAPDRSHA